MWSEGHPGAFPHPAQGMPALTTSPSLLGKPRAASRFPLALQHVGVTSCWRHSAHSRTFPISVASSHPWQLQKSTRGQTTDFELLLSSLT